MPARLGPSAAAAVAALEEKNATSQLRMQFPNDTVTRPGTIVTPAAAQPDPKLSLSVKINSQKRYLSVSIDPDAPFPSFPVLGPILHGLQTDLTATPNSTSTEGNGNGDGDSWTPLVADVGPIVDYAPPGPPKPSAPHRYVFLVWEQPAGMDTDTIRKTLGFAENTSLWERIRWDGQAFEEALGLGPAVAANYFLSSK